ncbi:transmembrane protein 135-like [Tubulanus polymorphus]|uniref:transmembrane protein 135-like n=1 Tax=Tubulanus polymorphus TaxID=672921 RepID=UPI003DA6A1AB
MAAFSKLEYSCYELGHTWTPHCSHASIGILMIAFKEAFKIYAPLYLTTALLKGRKLDYYLSKLLPEILRSSLFLATNCGGFITSFCLHRYLLGFASFISVGLSPGFMASFISILIERKNRRGLLALYTATIAVESLLRMLISRGLVRTINNIEVLVFSITAAVYMYLYRMGSLKEAALSGIRFFIGQDELPHSQKSDVSSSVKKQVRFQLNRNIKHVLDESLKQLRNGLKHSTCPHTYSCLSYVLEGAGRNILIGYGLQSIIRLFTGLPRFIQKPSRIIGALINIDNFKLAAFIGSFNCVFRLVSCLLRWLRNKDDELHAVVAGFLAGFSMLWYKSTTIAMYMTSKLCEILYFKGIKRGCVPYIKYADILLYTISTGVLLHTAIAEPHNLRPAYYRFIMKCTGNKLCLVNRQLLDGFGVKSSQMIPDFWPDYDPRFTDLASRNQIQQ